ncbi:MAG: cation transporter [Rhodopirellula sp.]|nr:cation transporter [Rhodopirellula sp.]
MTLENRDRNNLVAVNLGLIANALLALLKTAVGIVGHSPALLADGINSTSDTAYLIVVRIFMREAHKPPDSEHPYGHRQMESIAALVVGAFVITTAVAIFWTAVNDVYELFSGTSSFGGAGAVALWVALFTIVLKLGLTVFTRRIGEKTGSLAVQALAADHRNDIFSITAAALGILLGRAGYPWFDPLAAAFVAMVILYTGIGILRDSSADLMDVLAGEPTFRRVRQIVARVPGVDKVEDVHVHRIGIYLLVEVTIGVDGSLTVAAGDEIASQVEDQLQENIEYLRRVSVHYHPTKG